MMKILAAAALVAVCSCGITIAPTDWTFNGNKLGTPAQWFSTVLNSVTAYNPLGWNGAAVAAGYRCDLANGCPLNVKLTSDATSPSKYSITVTPIGAAISYKLQGSYTTAGAAQEVPVVLAYDPKPGSYVNPFVQEFSVVFQILDAAGNVLQTSSTYYTKASMTKYYFLQNTIIAGTNVISVPSTGKNRVAFRMANLVEPITISCTGYVSCSPSETGTFQSTPFAITSATAGQFDATKANGFFWAQFQGSAAHKLQSMAVSNVRITDGAGVVVNVPVSFTNVFSNLQSIALAPGQVTSAYGETGKTVYSNIPNQTINVNSVKNGRVADDEYRNVSAGIVYAAVGSAFAFVLCLGAIAATIGAKSAAKAAAL